MIRAERRAVVVGNSRVYNEASENESCSRIGGTRAKLLDGDTRLIKLAPWNDPSRMVGFLFQEIKRLLGEVKGWLHLGVFLARKKRKRELDPTAAVCLLQTRGKREREGVTTVFGLGVPRCTRFVN